MTSRETTEIIVVHCSATSPSMSVDADLIRCWHTWPKHYADGRRRYMSRTYASDADLPEAVRGKKGRGWLDIGYHSVILPDGTVEPGRPTDAVGAHVRGFNRTSLGVCLIGGVDEKGEPIFNFTKAAMASLATVLSGWHRQYPSALFQGHRDLDPAKACPCFDVPLWASEHLF